MSDYKWLMEQIAPYRFKLYAAAFLAVLSAILGLVPIVCVGELFRAYLASNLTKGIVINLAVISAGAIALRYFLYLSAMKLSHIAAYGLHYDLRMKLCAHLASLPLGFFTMKKSGELKKLMGDDVEIIEIFIGHYFSDLTASIVMPIVAAIYLFSINPLLAFVSLVPLIITYRASKGMEAVYKENIQSYHDNFSKMNSIIVEFINGIEVVKAFDKSRIKAKFDKTLRRHFEIAEHWTRASRASSALFRVSIDFVLVLVLGAGFWLYHGEKLWVADFTIFILFSVILLEPITRILMISTYLTRIFEGIARIRELLSQRALPQSKESVNLTNFEVKFENVHFAYENKEVLHNVSFTLPQGSHTYLIGESGAGKSTAALLLARFWDVGSGCIEIGGKDVREIPNLMEYLSFVFQQVFLIEGSVMENIKVGDEKASDEQAIKAAKDAMADDFIKKLKYGYATSIGENGAYLSGGEKQRISIARMLLKNSPILILDEATASTDPEIEQSIFEIFEKLKRGKTTLSITHKLNRLKDEDRVILLSGGEVKFEGLYGELKCLNLLEK